MDKVDFQDNFTRLREGLERTKALLAWERLKQSEASSSRIDTFQMHDRTQENLRNEYTFLLTALMNTRTILDDHTSSTSQAVRADLRTQLAVIQRQLHGLGLGRRFGGPVL